MKVLLAVPPRRKENIFHIVPPLGLGYLSKVLKKENVDVALVNCVKDGLDPASFVRNVLELKPDIVGYQVFSSDIGPVREALAVVRSRAPRIVQLVGGYHPSCVPEMAMTTHFPDADFGFAGEAELGLPALAGMLERGEHGYDGVPGLLWRRDGKLVVNAPRFCDDLDGLGMPDWDLINPLDYQRTLQTIMVKAMPVAPIVATRGCPFRCTFCAAHNINGRRVRGRSAENVVTEMDYLHRRFGIREFQLHDDNFTWRRDFVVRFCELLRGEGRRYFWSFPNGMRLDTIDRELLLQMKAAGCYSICVGIESGSDRVLKMIRKNLSVREIREKIRLIRSVGLPVTGSFILGFPGETLDDLRKTEEFILGEDLFAAHIFMFHPLPGTELFDELVKSGELDDTYLGYSAEHSSYADCVYAPKGITRAELKKIHRRINRAFYLRPKRIWTILSKLRSPRVIYYFVKRAIAYLFR